MLLIVQLSGIEVRVFFEAGSWKGRLCRHGGCCCCFCKSNVPLVGLIAGCGNMTGVTKIRECEFVKIWINGRGRFRQVPTIS